MSIPETDDDLDMDSLGLEAAYLPSFWSPLQACLDENQDETDDFLEYLTLGGVHPPEIETEFQADFSIAVEEH
jgi:hypothetical protein